jgi:hypothetical protein
MKIKMRNEILNISIIIRVIVIQQLQEAWYKLVKKNLFKPPKSGGFFIRKTRLKAVKYRKKINANKWFSNIYIQK